MNDDNSAQAVAAVSTCVEALQREMLTQAACKLTALGLPQAQIDQLLQVAAGMHLAQLALVERDVAAALGQGPAIH